MKSLSITILLVFIVVTSALCQFTGNEILGEWLSPKKDSRILIYKNDNKYFGKITWGTDSAPNDEKNPDVSKRGRQLIGLDILTDFVFDKDQWIDGTIYDPREGKTYSSKMTLQDKDKLNLRGFVGLSLFGRTETSTRFK